MAGDEAQQDGRGPDTGAGPGPETAQRDRAGARRAIPRAFGCRHAGRKRGAPRPSPGPRAARCLCAALLVAVVAFDRVAGGQPQDGRREPDACPPPRGARASALRQGRMGDAPGTHAAAPAQRAREGSPDCATARPDGPVTGSIGKGAAGGAHRTGCVRARSLAFGRLDRPDPALSPAPRMAAARTVGPGAAPGPLLPQGWPPRSRPAGCGGCGARTGVQRGGERLAAGRLRPARGSAASAAQRAGAGVRCP